MHGTPAHQDLPGGSAGSPAAGAADGAGAAGGAEAADGAWQDARAISDLVWAGRWSDPADALRAVEQRLPHLDPRRDGPSLLAALLGRAVLLHALQAPVDQVGDACDVLERAAEEQRSTLATGTAHVLRAVARLDAGDAAAAVSDLAVVDADQVERLAAGPVGFQVLDLLAGAYTRLHLTDRALAVRRRLEGQAAALTAVERGGHRAGWSVELVAQALEPFARGDGEPRAELLDAALELANRVDDEGAAAPPGVRSTALAVRALVAAHREQTAQALQLLGRLLGQDGGHQPRLPALPRLIALLAAMRALTLHGSPDRARRLDDAEPAVAGCLPGLVLDVCRARERLRLESQAGGDPVPGQQRLADLLVRLAWQSMEVVTHTSRTALEFRALRRESRTDALTGVGNRRALDEELHHLLRRGPLPLALVLLDVDRFKAVNDEFGHVVGDEVLRRVAACLAEQQRADDRLVRYGGDEFVVLLPRTGDQEARAVARRMATAIASLPWPELADGLSVEVTWGCAALWSLTERRPGADGDRLFQRADDALLAAKRGRRVRPHGDPAGWPNRRHRPPPVAAAADVADAAEAAEAADAAQPVATLTPSTSPLREILPEGPASPTAVHEPAGTAASEPSRRSWPSRRALRAAERAAQREAALAVGRVIDLPQRRDGPVS